MAEGLDFEILQQGSAAGGWGRGSGGGRKVRRLVSEALGLVFLSGGLAGQSQGLAFLSVGLAGQRRGLAEEEGGVGEDKEEERKLGLECLEKWRVFCNFAKVH